MTPDTKNKEWAEISLLITLSSVSPLCEIEEHDKFPSPHTHTYPERVVNAACGGFIIVYQNHALFLLLCTSRFFFSW